MAESPEIAAKPPTPPAEGRRRHRHHRPWYRKAFRKRTVITILATVFAVLAAIYMTYWLIGAFSTYKAPE